MSNLWQEKDNSLQRLFVFNNFEGALSFVVKVGEVAERLNHHPDIHLQNYKEVIISTTTHDQGNMVTEKDRALAEAVNALV